MNWASPSIDQFLAAARYDHAAAYRNASARLAELHNTPVDVYARMPYTENGKTYSWDAYQNMLLGCVNQLRDLMAKAQPPFTLYSTVTARRWP